MIKYNLEKIFRFISINKLILVLIIILCIGCGLIGYKIGLSNVYYEAYTNGYNEGSDLGYNDGFDMGKSDGYDIGYEDGLEASESSNNITKQINDSETVYCTSSGSCYHYSGCIYIEGKTGITEMSLSDAIASGYKACSRCAR